MNKRHAVSGAAERDACEMIVFPAAYCAEPTCEKMVPPDPTAEGWTLVQAEVARWRCPRCSN